MHPAPDLDPIAFDPVPTASTRHDGWTPTRQRAFIDALGKCGLVAAAAREVGMTPKSAYRLRARGDAASFAAAWDVAVDQGSALAADTAIERAMQGEVVPVFYRGLQVGERRRYDNRLLIAALRNWRPAAPDGTATLAAFLDSSHSNADIP
ncbi:MAG: hypothetical protein E7773_11710 [Sphingomonas sp.]|uniref:hypothetical protein n=1 Tax=Sphingomonas sp. TaxID=28214 RepID=UPI00121E2523|nr:hypothetical protein [Sphingomonas sp.]THD35118.1 MAG: hypothetical protein E7773_11710 [Sphingomonas sp.]